jgi:hypothetical protein
MHDGRGSRLHQHMSNYHTWAEVKAQMDARKTWDEAHPVQAAPRRLYRELRSSLHNLAHPRPWARARWRWQRAERDWADRDTWSLDSYLAQLIGSSVAFLRTHTHGYPSDITPELWDDILSRISQPLLAYHKHWDNYDEKYISEAQQALHLLAEHLPSLWD